MLLTSLLLTLIEILPLDPIGITCVQTTSGVENQSCENTRDNTSVILVIIFNRKFGKKPPRRRWELNPGFQDDKQVLYPLSHQDLTEWQDILQVLN